MHMTVWEPWGNVELVLLYNYHHMDLSISHPRCHDLTDLIFFFLFSPFLSSLYHCPEPSGTSYYDPLTPAMTHTLDHSSMTKYDVA